MIGCMGAGGILGAIGGTGFKFARRFILPLVLGVLAMLAGFSALKCSIMTLGLIIAFLLPYGSKTPYWGKFLVGCAFVAPTLALGLTYWQIITPIVFIIVFKLSNWKYTSGIFRWKICEFIIFAMIGITVASLL